MTAIEDARAALNDAAQAKALRVIPSPDRLMSALRALIAEHERLTAPPTDDEREALAATIVANRTWVRRMDDGYLSTGQNDDYSIADAILAAGFRRQGSITAAMIQRAREASAAQFGYYPTIEEATVILEAARATS